MFEDAKKFRDFPVGVKKAIYFTIAAWSGHLAWFFIYFQDQFPEKIFYKHLGMGVVICVFLILKKPWAKWLGVMGNLIVILYYIFYTWFALTHQNRQAIAIMMMGVIFLFSASTYYLFCRESNEFFKVRRDKTDPASG